MLKRRVSSVDTRIEYVVDSLPLPFRGLDCSNQLMWDNNSIIAISPESTEASEKENIFVSVCPLDFTLNRTYYTFFPSNGPMWTKAVPRRISIADPRKQPASTLNFSGAQCVEIRIIRTRYPPEHPRFGTPPVIQALCPVFTLSWPCAIATCPGGSSRGRAVYHSQYRGLVGCRRGRRPNPTP